MVVVPLGLLADESIEPHAFAQLTTRFQPREVEQVGDDPRQPQRFALELDGEAWSGIRILADDRSKGFGCRLDRCRGGLQLVGRVRDEVTAYRFDPAGVGDVGDDDQDRSLARGRGRDAQPARRGAAFHLDRHRHRRRRHLSDGFPEVERVE
ncbi:MAG: hypothetical protein M3P52_02310, partial [Actinomycetota bacterium]|nr:hypothetical protein [Actinomycetota bacterium]